MWEFIWGFVALIIGALVTWLCSRYYYKRAGDELRIEADRIRRLSTFICDALEQAGLTAFKRNKEGEIAAQYVELRATGRIKLGGTGTLTVDKRAEDSETPRDTH